MLRYLSISKLQEILDKALDIFSIDPRTIAFLGLMGLCAHYSGFMWALTNFNPFYSDWLFFLELSLGLIFVCALVALAIQIGISIIATLIMILSPLKPDSLMTTNRIVNFRIPLIGYQAVQYNLVGVAFTLILLIVYTEFNWWQIMMIMMMMPLLVIIWGAVAFYTLKNHRVEELEFDLGERFELSADTVQQAIDVIQEFQSKMEAYLNRVLPDNIRPTAEHIFEETHRIAGELSEYIPEKEAVHEDLTELQYKIAEMRWRIAYTRFALPKLRSIAIGVGLSVLILIGYGHERNYEENHLSEITYLNGDTKTAVPLSARQGMQALAKDGALFFENIDTIKSIRRISDEAQSPAQMKAELSK